MHLGRPDRSFAGLVDELDERLPRAAPVEPEPEMIQRRRPPAWGMLAFAALAFALVTSLAAGPGPSCEFDGPICRIENLDIDAALVMAPEAQLFELLPSIDVLDPDDSLTIGDALMRDELDGREPESLLSKEQIARIVDALD